VVLLGEVNAGKSSLLNALVGEERALVDAEPGTTRDLVEVDHAFEGVPVRLIDTAGWREATGVEARGIARGKDAAGEADLVLWISGNATPPPPPDPTWVAVAAQRDRHPGSPPPGSLAVSAHTGQGLVELGSAIARRLGVATGADEAVVARERQAQGLRAAAEALMRASQHRAALELVAHDAEAAARVLAGVLGRGIDEDVMDRVFAQFCIGK
jgi:tRNA modification GTPase